LLRDQLSSSNSGARDDYGPLPLDDYAPLPLDDERPLPLDDERPLPLDDERPLPLDDGNGAELPWFGFGRGGLWL
jgi:hypothetical protein